MRRHRPRKAPIRQLRKMEQNINRAIKRTSPNPRVQAPGTSAMPAQAPGHVCPKAERAQGAIAGSADRFFNAAAKIMTKSWNGNIFVWLPAISTDPNAGPTIGILPVLVLADPETHHIRHLFAPSVTYNDLFGTTGTWRYYYYPTDVSQLFTTASISQHTNRELKARYENSAAHDGVLYVRAETYYTVDASNRFYGIGPQTREGDETGYTSKDAVGRAAIGVNFAHSWRATIGTRFRRLGTDDTIIPDTTNLPDEFPTTPGIGTKEYDRPRNSPSLGYARFPRYALTGKLRRIFWRKNEPSARQRFRFCPLWARGKALLLMERSEPGHRGSRPLTNA